MAEKKKAWKLYRPGFDPAASPEPMRRPQKSVKIKEDDRKRAEEWMTKPPQERELDADGANLMTSLDINSSRLTSMRSK